MLGQMQTFVCKLNKDDPPLGYSSLHVNSHLSLFQENGAKWRADDKERGTTPQPLAAFRCSLLRRIIYEQARVNAEEKLPR